MMRWCPECKAEYTNDHTMCDDCGCVLREVSDDLDENINEPTFLTTAINGLEAQGIKTFLESEGIPVLFVHKGFGGQMTVIMGTSMDEVDIKVPKSCIQQAHALLKSSYEFEEDENRLEQRIDNELYDDDHDDHENDNKVEADILLQEGQSQWDLDHQNDSRSGFFSWIAILIGLAGVLIYLISRM